MYKLPLLYASLLKPANKRLSKLEIELPNSLSIIKGEMRLLVELLVKPDTKWDSNKKILSL